MYSKKERIIELESENSVLKEQNKEMIENLEHIANKYTKTLNRIREIEEEFSKYRFESENYADSESYMDQQEWRIKKLITKLSKSERKMQEMDLEHKIERVKVLEALKKCQNEKEKLVLQVNEFDKEINVMKPENAKLNEELIQLRKDKSKLTVDILDLKESVVKLEEKNKQLLEDNSRQASNFEEMLSAKSKLTEEVDCLMKTVEANAEALAQYQSNECVKCEELCQQLTQNHQQHSSEIIRLKNAMKDAEDRYKMDVECIEQRLEIRDHQITELTNNLSNKTQAEEDQLKRLERLNLKFNEMQHHLTECENQLQIYSKTNEGLSLERNKLTDQISQLTAAHSKLNAQYHILQQEHNQLQQYCDKLNADNTDSNKLLNKYQKELQHQQDQCNSRNRDVVDLELDKDKLLKHNKELQLHLEQLDLEKSQLNKYYKEEIQKLLSQISDLDHDRSEMKQTIIQMKTSQTNYQQTQAELEDQLQDRISELKSLKVELEDCDGKLCKEKKQTQKFQKTIEELRDTVCHKTKQIEAMQQERQSNDEYAEELKLRIESLNIRIKDKDDHLNKMKEELSIITEQKQQDLQQLNSSYQRISSLEETQRQLLTKISSCESKELELQNYIHREQKEFTRKNQEISNQLATAQQKIQAQQSEITDLLSTNDNINKVMSNSQLRIVDLTRELDRAQQQIREMSEQLELRYKQLANLEKDLSGKLKEYEEALRLSQNKECSLENEVFVLTNKLEHFQKSHEQELERVKTKLTLQEENLRLYKEETEEYKQQLVQLQEKESRSTKQYRQQITNYNNQVTQLRKDIAQSDSKIVTLEAQQQTRSDQLTKCQERLKKLRNNQSQLELDRMKAIKDQEAICKELEGKITKLTRDHQKQISAMDQSKTKLVSQLAEIQEKYEESQLKISLTDQELIELNSQMDLIKSVMSDQERQINIKTAIIERFIQNCDSSESSREKPSDELYSELSLQQLLSKLSDKYDCNT